LIYWCSLFFLQIGLATGHHHPKIWQSGNTCLSSRYSLDV
jgi:hypothetical protein